MTVKHFHYTLVAHALRIMMTSACLIACVVTQFIGFNCTEFMHQTAYKIALLQQTEKISQNLK